LTVGKGELFLVFLFDLSLLYLILILCNIFYYGSYLSIYIAIDYLYLMYSFRFKSNNVYLFFTTLSSSNFYRSFFSWKKGSKSFSLILYFWFSLSFHIAGSLIEYSRPLSNNT